MKLDNRACRKSNTVKHDLPNGGIAITLPDGGLVAYRKQTVGQWQWIRKGFQFFKNGA